MGLNDSSEGKYLRMATEFACRCVSIDLEVGKADTKIHQIGAVCLESQSLQISEFSHAKGPLTQSLVELERFASAAEFSVGHNFILFDRKHLLAARPDLGVALRPAVDTLWLNPLAFPRNPYHHLVKHYQDGQLQSGQKNNPVADARLTLDVLVDQFITLRRISEATPELVAMYHWLTTRSEGSAGFDAFFSALRGQAAPDLSLVQQYMQGFLADKACITFGREAVGNAAALGWSLAFAFAWLSVAGSNSVVPPWVSHQFPKVREIIRHLRDTPCDDPTCAWCTSRHDATKELRRWFPALDGFRPEPVSKDGRPLQQVIVKSAMRGENVLAILPTGTGKSICYQIPALSRFDKTGALTVVISPLVALMADQVNGLEARGITCSAAINGLLSMPERAAVLERVRLGDIGILIVSPEQLRNRTLRSVLAQREIGAWVLDEAHCISKWGHDFRPDYRYVGRFIKEKAGTGPIPPILCLTATAKPDVVTDIIDHFSTKVGVDLRLFDGGASRSNLSFSVMPTTPSEKMGHILQVLTQVLPPGQPGGAIVYCSTRKKTEEVAEFLQTRDIAAGFFHAGMQPTSKKLVQGRFIQGDLQVIAYLIRVRREKPEGILALTYNRHAAVEIRRRLHEMIGEDARGVLVMTCHAMAMRLVGASFANKSDSGQTDVFKQVLLDAIALLKGDGLPLEEADEQRDRLLAGFRRILVDEYQDIGPEQYELISALAGRNRRDEEGKNTLFAVGDDDQNIYAFNGASVDFIRRFESDYDARPTFLIENYRSTGHIVGASNAVIALGKDRMKVDHPIEVDRARQKAPPGGVWTEKDSVARGRVQLLVMPSGVEDPDIRQAAGLMAEFERLRQVDEGWKWSECAVIAREWKYLDPVRAWCEINQVPVQVANEDTINIWRLRETQALVKWVRALASKMLSLTDIYAWIAQHESNCWWQLLQEAIDAYRIEVAGLELPGNHLIDWLAEWGREVRRKQVGVVLLTAHRAKGLEFRHVGVLDGGWDRDGRGADPDETRRLFYVAMTRAKQTLLLAQAGKYHRYSEVLKPSPHVLRREVHLGALPAEYGRRYIAPSLSEIDIGYAGRFAPTHRVHHDIAGLDVGSPLLLVRVEGKWCVTTMAGQVVGRMSKKFEIPQGKHFVDAKVLAIQTRNVSMVDADYLPMVKTQEWEVVLPELVFE